MSIHPTSDAAAAALAAGVTITEAVTPEQIDELRAAKHDIWGPEVVAPRNLLRGMAIGGACLLVAKRDDVPVGFALGWLGWADGVHLHSHQVGVAAELRKGGVGFALKLAQRSLCLGRGITEMRWTFDPMLAANARFNLVRLGAVPVAFLPHCYGDRVDAFNTGDTTDRVEVAWRLDRPVGGQVAVAGPGDDVVALPPDFHALRADDPVRADEWRTEVRDAIAGALDDGRDIGFGDDGWVLYGDAA
jgi:predicted GNAT superfamily acetyltransferase